MKSVLIAIQPKWCELIAEGKKTVEVRKTKPKLDVPFKCYIYMTAGDASYPVTINGAPYTCHNNGGMVVIGEFICDEIYHIKNHGTRFSINNDERLTNGVARASCLDFYDIKNYIKDKNGYAWHITDLVIYDEPKELGEFKPYNRECKYSHLGYAIPECKYCHGCQVTRPPMSWMFIEGV